jgi:shikimate kinase
MGTGKTAAGKLLARRLGLTFIDTDEEVEAATGLTPSEIFRRYGEERFRSEESRVVMRVARRRGCVIATGGGVVLRRSNMARLRRKGIVILLEAAPEAITRRVSRYDTRPLLSGSIGARSRLRDRIAELLQQRAPFYADCDHRIDTSALSPEQVVAEIMDYLQGRGYWEVRCEK